MPGGVLDPGPHRPAGDKLRRIHADPVGNAGHGVAAICDSDLIRRVGNDATGIRLRPVGGGLTRGIGGVKADLAEVAQIRVELPVGELTADFLDRTQMRTSSPSSPGTPRP